MPRILGVDIPPNKKLEYSLRYVFGIGPTRAAQIVKLSGFDQDRRASDLSEEEVNQLASIIADKQFIVEGDLRREVTGNIKRLMDINCYRGTRHKKGLPARGQRTKTNARTRKGPRKMAVKKNA